MHLSMEHGAILISNLHSSLFSACPSDYTTDLFKTKLKTFKVKIKLDKKFPIR